jgi:hypothetical protein
MHILFLFLDGVGLGADAPAINPLASAAMPHVSRGRTSAMSSRLLVIPALLQYNGYGERHGASPGHIRERCMASFGITYQEAARCLLEAWYLYGKRFVSGQTAV